MVWKPMLPVMPPPLNPLQLPGTYPGEVRDPLLASRSHSYPSSCPSMVLLISDDKTKPKPTAPDLEACVGIPRVPLTGQSWSAR